MKAIMMIFAALFAGQAWAQKAEAPMPAPEGAKVAAVVLDPTNLIQNALQVAKQIEAIRKQVEQIKVAEDMLKVDKDILLAETGIRTQIARLLNSDEHKAARRYMPADFLCAMNVGTGDCSGGSPAFGQHAAFLNEVLRAPQASAIFSEHGAMAPEQHAAYYWSQNAANAAMASSMTVSEEMNQQVQNVEDLMLEIEKGHARDLKGSTDLNTRATLELANQQNLTNRLLSQMVFMQGMDAQRDVANISAAARSLQRIPPPPEEAADAEFTEIAQ